jgi:hypothetical protein
MIVRWANIFLIRSNDRLTLGYDQNQNTINNLESQSVIRSRIKWQDINDY